MNDLEPMTKSVPRVIHSMDDLKKALDDGYYMYWIDTEGGMVDPSLQYLLQHDYIEQIGPAKVEPDKLAEMWEHIAKTAKLYEMHCTLPDTRIIQ